MDFTQTIQDIFNGILLPLLGFIVFVGFATKKQGVILGALAVAIVGAAFVYGPAAFEAIGRVFAQGIQGVFGA